MKDNQPQAVLGKCDECDTPYSYDPTDGGTICVRCMKERVAEKEADRQYHMNAINRIAKVVGALGETSDTVAGAVERKLAEAEQQAGKDREDAERYRTAREQAWQIAQQLGDKLSKELWMLRHDTAIDAARREGEG